MQTNPVLDAEDRDGQLARALNVALHALVVHDGMHGMMEGEPVHLHFEEQIRQIRTALEFPGVGASETLPYQPPGR